MKKLIILLAIIFTTKVSNAQTHGLLNMGHYVPEKLQELVIEESECVDHAKDTVWYASIPFENKNYVYKIYNAHGFSEFTECSKKRLHPAYKKIIGIPTFFIVWGAMLVLL